MRAPVLLSLVALVSAGIYPDDLFSSKRSVKLNSETFDDHIAAEVASGRYVANVLAFARARRARPMSMYSVAAHHAAAHPVPTLFPRTAALRRTLFVRFIASEG